MSPITSARSTAAGVPSAVTYGKSGNKWIANPDCYSGNMQNYRISSLKKAGFLQVSGDDGRISRICQGQPSATERWAEWRSATPPATATAGCIGACGRTAAIWSTKDDKVILNSPETAKALEYAKQLYENMIRASPPGRPPPTTKAFLAGEIHWTDNVISIYVAATKDPTKKEIAEDMDHAFWPIGPIGKPTELHLMYPVLAMKLHQIPSSLEGADRVHAGRPTSSNKWNRFRTGLSHPLPQRL